ncbi:unnamed protein product [Nezara viridula]|uniref:Uncharacterized protein n=1 Tax=Nezara viridula TaxID=85310 RepID=A0A9P0HG89_NEZVI|nr:unnamed protein product [Nezara viridula]
MTIIKAIYTVLKLSNQQHVHCVDKCHDCSASTDLSRTTGH